MPELPEVEVSRQGVEPHLVGQTIARVVIRRAKLRWPIPEAVKHAEGQVIRSVTRRAKILFINTDVGSIVVHLGMTGYLRVFSADTPVAKHDHFEFTMTNGQCFRLNDSRTFGAVLWQAPHESLAMLAKLGPEPLSDDFGPDHLFRLSRNKHVAVKPFIMNNANVVGVGNIYANEALFRSGIHPKRAAGNISKARYRCLTENIKLVLAEAIKQGGTTLRDFSQANGNPGYFKQALMVYDRAGEPCTQCGKPIKSEHIGQRNSFYCGHCQR